MRKIKTICLILALALVIIIPVQAAVPDVNIVIDGKAITVPDQKLYIDAANRTMVPVRAPMEAIGCKVDWDDVQRQAIISKDKTTAVFPIGSKTYTVNGITKSMDTRAVIAGDRTAFPIRFAAEAMGATVGWDPATYTVLIDTNERNVGEVLIFKATDAPGKELLANVAGYSITVTNSCGGRADWLYINSDKDIRVSCENDAWNEYTTPNWVGDMQTVRLDIAWRKSYLLPGLIPPMPQSGEVITLNVYGKIDGKEVKLLTINREV